MNTTTIRVTILGCGGSQGVPTAAGVWGKCDPSDPRNRRLRSSVLVETQDQEGVWRKLLIDTTPDFRRQMIDSGTERLDAVLFTHAHADHLHGIDDLRSFNRAQGHAIPIFANAVTLADIGRRFGYTIDPIVGSAFYKPTLVPNEVDGPFVAAGVAVRSFVQDHGFSTTLGFRVGNFAYTTDAVRLDETAMAVLEGIELWIVDCLRIEPVHPTHAHLARTLEWIDRIGPKRAVLTHMDIETDYRTLSALLPENAEPGIDGMVLEI